MTGERGFTLLEVLVALAIGGLAIAGWLALQGDFTARWLGGEQQRQAVLLGESLTDRLGRDLPVRPAEGREMGFGGLAWRLSVQPIDAPIQVGNATWHLHAYSIAIGHDMAKPILLLQGRRLAQIAERS